MDMLSRWTAPLSELMNMIKLVRQYVRLDAFGIIHYVVLSHLNLANCTQPFSSNCSRYIRITWPCNVYPLIPHFYLVKLGYAGVYLFFLFLLQNIDCVYSLEPVPTIYVLSKNKKNIIFFLLKIFNFYNFKNLCILHGRVFVMI